MAQKPTKIDDVKRSGRAAPLPTSRPIVVTNRPMLANDPMVVSAAQETDDVKPAPAIVRTAKVIKPLDATLDTGSSAPTLTPDPKEPETPETPGSMVPEPAVDIDALHGSKVAETEAAAQTAAVTDAESAISDEVAKSEMTAQIASNEKSGDQLGPKLARDPEAELSAEEIAAAEAQAKRDLELEQVIASGKYRLPINAVQRRRSRMHVLLLCAIGLLLAVVLADVVVDAGFIKLRVNLPHTHFFSTTASGS